jgi:hypothetical protein
VSSLLKVVLALLCALPLLLVIGLLTFVTGWVRP